MHHVGVTVANLDRAISFYHDVLGLELAHEPTGWFEDEELGEGIRVPGASVRLVSFKAGSVTLELLEYGSPPSPTQGPLSPHAIGSSHVAFLVEDIEAKMKELSEKGVEFFSGVNVVDEGPLAGWRWVYFADPEGYPLELVEIAYAATEERERAVAVYLSSRAFSVKAPAPARGATPLAQPGQREYEGAATGEERWEG